MQFKVLLALLSSASALALPTVTSNPSSLAPFNVVQNLAERAPQPSSTFQPEKRANPSVTLYRSRNGAIRLWGILQLPAVIFDVFAEPSAPERARDVANNIYQHLERYVNLQGINDQMIKYYGTHAAPTFSSLFQSSGDPPELEGSFGASIDLRSWASDSNAVAEYLSRLQTVITDYFSEQNIDVNVIQVDDAFSIGNPRQTKRSELEGSLEARGNGANVCANPIDLRKYFVTGDPTGEVPDSYSYC